MDSINKKCSHSHSYTMDKICRKRTIENTKQFCSKTAQFVSGFTEPKMCSLMVSVSCPVFLNIWVLGSPGSCMVDEAGLRFGKTTFSKVIIEVIFLKKFNKCCQQWMVLILTVKRTNDRRQSKR